jgi:hypothetical protein
MSLLGVCKRNAKEKKERKAEFYFGHVANIGFVNVILLRWILEFGQFAQA